MQLKIRQNSLLVVLVLGSSFESQETDLILIGILIQDRLQKMRRELNQRRTSRDLILSCCGHQ